MTGADDDDEEEEEEEEEGFDLPVFEGGATVDVTLSDRRRA